MKVKLFLFFVLLSTMVMAKQKMLILSCGGGFGHESVSNSLISFVGNKYDIDKVDVFTEVLKDLDPIKTITFNKLGCVDFYNYCLRNRWIWAANNLSNMGRKMVLWRKNGIQKLIDKYVDKVKPDIIVSVVPLINHSTLNVAKNHNIPFIVLTNDLDSGNYIHGISKPMYDKFKYVLTYNDKDIKSVIKKKKLKESQVGFLGFPLRPSFLKTHDRVAIKNEFNLPSDKPIVMLLMGGVGSDANYQYVKQIARMKIPMHLVVCLGKDKMSKKKIDRLKLPSNITLTTLGFTDKIPEIMAVSNLLITKSGPNSISEALYMNLPMIIDKTSRVLSWEKMNIDFVKKNKLGSVVKKYKKIRKVVNKYLTDKKFYASVKSNLISFDKPNFKDGVTNLFSEMLSK